MNVLVVEPNKLPYEKEINGLKEMQAVVGGSIEAAYPFDDPVALVCHAEGLLIDLPFNRAPNEDTAIFGTFFVCGLGEEDFESLTPDLCEKYKARFKDAELLWGVSGGKLIVTKTPVEPKKEKGPKPKHPSRE